MAKCLLRYYATAYILNQFLSHHSKVDSRGMKDLTDLESKVLEEVRKVKDPETGMTFAEMQMITNVKENEPGVVQVEFVPTSPFCPIAFKLASDVKNAANKVPGVKKALVYCRGHAMEQQINEMTNK